MAKVEFLGPIKKNSIEVDISSLHELRTILNDDITLQEWLRISSIAVNNEIVSSLDVKISQNDTISILPPVCGG